MVKIDEVAKVQTTILEAVNSNDLEAAFQDFAKTHYILKTIDEKATRTPNRVSTYHFYRRIIIHKGKKRNTT